MSLRKILVDGLQVETTDAGAQAIEKLSGQLATSNKALDDTKSSHAAELADKDKEIAGKDAEIEKLKNEQLSDADIDTRVEVRAALVDAARKIDPKVKTEGVSDADIRKAVVTTKLGDTAVADKSEAYIEARFDALADVSGVSDDPLNTIIKPRDGDNADAWGKAVFDSAGVDMKKEA